MRIDWLRPLIGPVGPFATVYLDATRGIAAGEREVEGRWRVLRRELAAQGASAALCDAVEERLATPFHLNAPHGRVIIANEDDGVLVERVLADPPPVSRVEYGPVPFLLEAARSADQSVDHLVVVVDRHGADLTWSWGGDPARQPQPVTVEGGHDAINKVRTGTTADRRIDHRAEDSWARNAEVVAREVDAQVSLHRAEVVVLTGDVRSAGLVRAALSRATSDLVVELPGASRSAGAHPDAFAARLRAVDAARCERRREATLDAFRAGHGRDDGSITSLGDVVAVLRRGQVAELLLAESFGSEDELDTAELWVSDGPLEIGTSRDDVEALGTAGGIYALPAPIALARAAVGQDAGLTFVPDGAVELSDGVGAVLRWHDAGTPSETAPTMSADRGRLRDVG